MGGARRIPVPNGSCERRAVPSAHHPAPAQDAAAQYLRRQGMEKWPGGETCRLCLG